MATVNVQRPGKDPLLECNYLVEIEGVADVGFMEFSDIKKTKAVAQYRTGNGPIYKYKQAGLETYEPITLRIGVFKDYNVLRDWYDSGERKSVDIVRLTHGRTGNRRARVYRFYEALPTVLADGKGDAMSEDSDAIGEFIFEFETYDIDP